ncbi:MAG: hypothetical protein KDE20_21880 [Caldilineaceae bacterium]|nr:hypothetical protein [Caldilineaceae bacterium]
MTRLWPQGQPIDVATDSHGRPVRFDWQGRSHRLKQVQQRWQVDTDWWSEEGRVWRDYQAVITTDGLLCVLYLDLLEQRWYLAKLYD